jgi:hypothetical protein
VVIAALVLGSSLMAPAQLSPLVGDISLLSIVGFVIALELGVWLMVGMLREGGK